MVILQRGTNCYNRNSESSKSKIRIRRKITAAGKAKDVKIVVQLKYLSNF